jgi:hypothetical protein
MKSTDLCVPIYLNQKVVFDLLAMLEDGFSQLHTVKTSTSESDAQKDSYGGSVGLSQFVAFLSVSMRGDKSKEKSAQNLQEATAEKVHTPTSLFFKLRSLLQEGDLLKRIETIDDLDYLATGQLVELKALLRKNPLVDYIETFKGIMKWSPYQQSQAKGGKPNKTGGGSGRGRAQDHPAVKEMDSLLTALTENNSLELIGEMSDVPSARAVLSTNPEYFNDKSASEIIDGEFLVLGKVARVVDSETVESINLLRKTAFGRLPSEVIDNLGTAIAGAQEVMNLPEFTTEIDEPAIQVIPIAIFV